MRRKLADPFHFLVDECLGKRVPAAMREHLLADETLTTVVEWAGVAAQDEGWMPRAGHDGYVIITADFDARFAPNVRRAVLESKCAVFTVKSGRADEVAGYVKRAMPTMRRVLRGHSLALIGRIIPSDGSILLHTADGEAVEPKRSVRRPKQ